MNGVSRSLVKAVTTLANAAPTTTPTAMSTTLPRRMNCLNPLSMEPPKDADRVVQQRRGRQMEIERGIGCPWASWYSGLEDPHPPTVAKGGGNQGGGAPSWLLPRKPATAEPRAQSLFW